MNKPNYFYDLAKINRKINKYEDNGKSPFDAIDNNCTWSDLKDDKNWTDTKVLISARIEQLKVLPLG